MGNNRRSYMDFLRVLACFFVIFNHTPGYFPYHKDMGFLQAFYYLGYTMITRINVPIFFMISGSLLLTRMTTYKELFAKRIARIVITLVCASFVAYLANFRCFDVIDFCRRLLWGEIAGEYWYLYAYISFLLMLPFLQRVAKNFNHNDFLFFVIIRFVFVTFFPLLNYILVQFDIPGIGLSYDIDLPLTLVSAFFYPLIGYYIDRVVNIGKFNRRNIWILPVVIIVGVAISSGFTYHQGITDKYQQTFVQTFDYTSAIATFLLVKYIFTNSKAIQNCDKFQRIISFVGSLTFGIYLMDPVLKHGRGYFSRIVTTNNLLVYSIAWCVCSMIICGTATYVLKKLPVIKNLL